MSSGATYTKHLDRRNTHLICNVESGQKYERAKEWGVEIVGKNWIYEVVEEEEEEEGGGGEGSKRRKKEEDDEGGDVGGVREEDDEEGDESETDVEGKKNLGKLSNQQQQEQIEGGTNNTKSQSDKGSTTMSVLKSLSSMSGIPPPPHQGPLSLL